MTLDSQKAKRLWRYLRPYWRLQLATFLVMIVVAGLALALPAAIQYMIDDLIPSMTKAPDVSLRPVVFFGLFLIGIYFLNVVFSAMRDYFAARMGSSIIVDMRTELFDHLQRVSLRFYQHSQVGEIMSRLLSDVSRIQDLLTSTLLTFVTNILLLAAILIYIFNINWLLTLIALIPVPLTILLSHRFGKKLHVVARKLQETTAAISARLQEAFSSTRVIRAFGQEDTERRKVHDVFVRLRGYQVRTSVLTSVAYNFMHFVNMVGPIVVLSWGTYLVAGGRIQLGALIAFYILLGYLYAPIKDLAAVNVELQAAMASVDRIFAYLDLPPAIVEADNAVSLGTVKGAVTLENICFSYAENGFRLDNLSLHIEPGEKIAIVGPSGSGKTTLVNLILRFFDPTSGRILLDGVDVRQLAVASLRSHIGLVDQDPLLFRASIFENIAYGDPKAGLEAVIQAAQVANIHEFISSLPDGYNNQVGERGVTLSGGEKQRLCLARAILRDPPILILDEATSALDSNSEQLIQEALKHILVNKTAIIIAHRFATIQHADRIIAIDRGRIVDQGRHEELLVRSPLYRELASKQLLT